MSTSAQLRAASQTLAERAGWLETALDVYGGVAKPGTADRHVAGLSGIVVGAEFVPTQLMAGEGAP